MSNDNDDGLKKNWRGDDESVNLYKTSALFPYPTKPTYILYQQSLNKAGNTDFIFIFFLAL